MLTSIRHPGILGPFFLISAGHKKKWTDGSAINDLDDSNSKRISAIYPFLCIILVFYPSLKTPRPSHFGVSKPIFQFLCFIKRFVKNTKSNFKLIYHTDWYWDPPLPSVLGWDLTRRLHRWTKGLSSHLNFKLKICKMT